MKLAVEIDLDFLSEEGTLGDQIQEQIINSVITHISTVVQKTLEEKIARKAEDRIDMWITETLEKFTSRPIKVTDRYGDIQETHENIIELLKQKFDNFLGEAVDEYGKPSKSCGYGKQYTRIERLIDAKIKERAEKFGQDILKQSEHKAQQYLSDELKKTLADKMANSILAAAKEGR